jgi:glycosyltransferase involved in cell wall biosynthesis
MTAAELAVYDFDDALQWDDGGGLHRRVAPKPPKCHAAVRSADRVIAGNDTLADWATGLCQDVVVIPSCVDPAGYQRKTSYSLADPPLLIWVGSPSTERYLRLISTPLLDFHRRSGARLRLVSGADASLGPLDVMIDRVQWRRDRVGGLLAGADVAIAPLADGPYERGKCAYKIIEYAATGLPVIGSPVGANELALKRFGGYAPSVHDDWSGALDDLVSMSANARRRLGEVARRAVEEHYSFSSWSIAWTDAVGLGGFRARRPDQMGIEDRLFSPT